MSKEFITACHMGTIGDVYASMPAMKRFTELKKKKLILYLMKDIPAKYYEGANHPTRDKSGQNVHLNQDMIDMMIPLFKAQPWIEDCLVHEEGMQVDLDLNAVTRTFVNMPYHSLSKWYFYVYPDLTCDLSVPFMEVPETDVDYAKGKIIVSRSERYNNDKIDYSFLKRYEKDLIFTGLMREYNNFCMTFDLEIPKLTVNNFLELAQAIKQSKGLLSNQTMVMQIAEMLKTPRAVELCSFAPNVCTQGANGYEFYNDYAAEYFVNKMLGTEAEYFDRLVKEKAAEAANENTD